MTEAQSSDAMNNLAFIMIVLIVLGTILALEIYLGIELPHQQAAHMAPLNIIN